MNRVSLACIRLLFFVMLFISTACNKVDRSLSAAPTAAPTAASGPAMAEAASVPSADEARIAALSARVQYLEAELNRVNQQTASDIPGGVTWD